MHPMWLVVLFGTVILTFCGMIVLILRAWPRISNGRRIASSLLLLPHLLLIVCVLVSLAYGQQPQGSPGFNSQFASDVLIVFILPVPALAGTVTAFALLISGTKNG